MTIAELRPVNPHSDDITFSIDPEPLVTIVGGADLLADDDDGTYVSVLTQGSSPFLTAPRFSAQVPGLSNVETVNSLTMRWRFRSVPTPDSTTGYVYARMQLFITTLPAPIIYPYDQTYTETLASHDIDGADASDWVEEVVDISYAVAALGLVGFLAALSSGRVYMRWQYRTPIGEITEQQVSEAALIIDYDPLRRQPLRQVGRPDFSRQYPRAAVDGSRQVSQIP